MLTRFVCLCSLTALLLISVGCQQAPPPSPPDTHDADVAAIKNTEVQWNKAFSTKDVHQATSFYAENASLLLPNSPILNSRESIMAALAPMLDDPNFKLQFAASRVDVAKSGELGYSQGAYTMTLTNPKTKKPIEDKGKYLTVFKKQAGGSWKAVEDTFMSDLPAPGAK